MKTLVTSVFVICLLNIRYLHGQKLLNPEKFIIEREKLMTPLRIYAHFKEYDRHLTERDILAIKESVYIATNYMKEFLSVISVRGKLLLKRNACARSWLDGPNKGRCASRQRDYNGEICVGDFSIPDQHLEEFVVWEYNASEPRTEFSKGEGVGNVDYILYVQAVMTRECVLANYKSNQNLLIAYAANCRQRHRQLQASAIDGRPVAGYINFCPNLLKESTKHKYKLIITVIHELLHNLGFSKDYFHLFKDCSKVIYGIACPPQRFQMYRRIGNYSRMLTTSVLRQMKKQFLCDDPDFGGPLDMKRVSHLKDAYIVQSHWDGKQMYGSIMSPSVGPPELTFVDPVSLAVLEDSGWYKVNYSNADLYPWGHGKGCDFGNRLEDFDIGTCKVNNENVVNGCNVYHTHKIVCSDLGTLDSEVIATNGCDKMEISWHKDNSKEANSFLYRCLLSNFTNTYLNSSIPVDTSSTSVQGKCFKVKCLDSKKIEVIISDSVSVPCPIGKIIDVVEFGYSGIIVCPTDTDLICFQRSLPLYFKLQPEKTTATDVMIGNVTVLPRFDRDDVLKSSEGHKNNMTSNGRPVVFYEQMFLKVFYTSIFCLITLYSKLTDRLLFCMF